MFRSPFVVIFREVSFSKDRLQTQPSQCTKDYNVINSCFHTYLLVLLVVNTDRPVTACNLSAHPVKQSAYKVILTKLQIADPTFTLGGEKFADSRYCDVI